MLRETLIFSGEFWKARLVGKVVSGGWVYSAVRTAALPLTEHHLTQDVSRAHVGRSCLGVPSEKRDIGAHVVASYFIPGTSFPVLERNESSRGYLVGFVGKPGK